jgi:hypothetical protein
MTREELKQVYIQYTQKRNGRLPKPITPDVLEHLYDCGLIRKENLKDGQHYYGNCRNACVARWNAVKGVFTYMRTKYETRFSEDINHPVDDNLYDLFEPVAECEPEEHEKIV